MPQRSWLDRVSEELPGFLIMFVAGAMLTVFRETQMAAAAMLLTALGAIGLGYLAPTHAALVVFIVIWSLGDHIIFAVEGPIGLKLAKGGKEGRRLGQFGGARNLGTILGVGVIFVLARTLGDRFSLFYAIAAGSALIAGVLYAGLNVRPRRSSLQTPGLQKEVPPFLLDFRPLRDPQADLPRLRRLGPGRDPRRLGEHHRPPLLHRRNPRRHLAPTARRSGRLARRAHCAGGRRGPAAGHLPDLRLRRGFSGEWVLLALYAAYIFRHHPLCACGSRAPPTSRKSSTTRPTSLQRSRWASPSITPSP